MRYLFNDFALDTDRRELRRGDHLVAVEPKVFDFLAHVIANHERVVSKDDLIAAVWDGRIVSESALTSCINAARSAIGDNGEAQSLIKTLPRKGLRFVGAVRQEGPGNHKAVKTTQGRFCFWHEANISGADCDCLLLTQSNRRSQGCSSDTWSCHVPDLRE